MSATNLGRRIILTLAANRAVTRFVSRYGMRLGASRFIAGETLTDAIAVTRRLNADGIAVTLDRVGESVADAAEATAMADAYIEMLDHIAASGVDSNVSLKPTQMGMDISADLCHDNVERIVAHARRLGNFVRIDMEGTPHLDGILDLFAALRQRYDNVGTVIQAYLYRSADDLEKLARLGANIRLVKGAYLEPPSLAFPKKADVDENFRRLIAQYLAHGPYTAIATHDLATIDWCKRHIAEHNIPFDRFEFQMLYGIRSETQRSLARAGYKVRCYVPFGQDWYPYFSRRLAERPANLFFVLGSLFRR